MNHASSQEQATAPRQGNERIRRLVGDVGGRSPSRYVEHSWHGYAVEKTRDDTGGQRTAPWSSDDEEVNVVVSGDVFDLVRVRGSDGSSQAHSIVKSASSGIRDNVHTRSPAIVRS